MTPVKHQFKFIILLFGFRALKTDTFDEIIFIWVSIFRVKNGEETQRLTSEKLCLLD